MAGTNQIITQGVHHVGLTVLSLKESRAFFEDILGYTLLGEKPDYPAAFITDGTTMLTLWEAKSPADAIGFDRHKNLGLHHLALAVADSAALDEVYSRVKEAPGVTIEFGPEPSGNSGALHMMCTIPGGPRVEFRCG